MSTLQNKEIDELIIYLCSKGHRISEIANLMDCTITYVCTVLYNKKFTSSLQ